MMQISTPFGTQLNATSHSDNKKQAIKSELNNDLKEFLAAQSQRNPRLRNQRNSIPDERPPVAPGIYLKRN
jgi:hypothetical protein